MEPNGDYLRNQYIKLKNPVILYQNVHNYVGDDFATFEWKRQQNNFDKFIEQLAHFDINPTIIHAAKWNPLNQLEQPNRFSFILETSDPNLIWFRKDQNAPGLSYNYVYYKKNKILLTKFNGFTLEELTNFLER